MEEPDLLEALDRRARRAVTALDGGLGAVDLAPLPIEPDGGRRRPWRPLLVAAGLVVVALLGVGFALADRGDEEGTVADDGPVPVESDDGGMTRLALADPAALGYEVRAAFDADSTQALVDPAPIDLHWMAHVPEGRDPAEAPIVLSGVLPSDVYDFAGEVVDIGGPDAVLRVLGPQLQLSWLVEDEVRRLSSVHLAAEDLIGIARAAVTEGWDGGAALPGHELLHRGPIAEFSPTLAYAGGGPTGREGIAYDHPGPERDLAIGWSSGPDPQARWDARRTMATETAVFEVRGQPARYHRTGPRSDGELSWLEPDGTLVEVVFLGDPADIVPLLDAALAPISAAEHVRLLAGHPPELDQALLDFPDRHLDPISEAPNVAELLAESPSGRTRVAITSHELTGLHLAVEVETDDGLSVGGSGYPLPDLRTPVVQLNWLGDPASGFVLAGVVPPGTDARGVTITERSTGRLVAAEQVSTGGIPGSDHDLFLAIVTGTSVALPIEVTFPTADGERTWRL